MIRPPPNLTSQHRKRRRYVVFRRCFPYLFATFLYYKIICCPFSLFSNANDEWDSAHHMMTPPDGASVYALSW